MLYLSGAANMPLRAVAKQRGIGLMLQPGNGYIRQLDYYPHFAADNGCFNRVTYIGDEGWLRWLDSLPRDGCWFATAPDVVGDAVATWDRSLPFFSRLQSMGFKAALVAQDGFWNVQIRWEAFDCIFIGGSTDWKLGAEARSVIAEAQRRKMWTHVGRVNSYKRFKLFADLGVDSVDGTYLAFGPSINLPKLLNWIDRCSIPTKEAA